MHRCSFHPAAIRFVALLAVGLWTVARPSSLSADPLTAGLLTADPLATDPDVRLGASAWRNPVVRFTGPAARPTQSDAPAVSAASNEALVDILAEHAAARTASLTIELAYDFTFDQVEEIVDSAVDRVLAADDYLCYTFGGYGAGWGGSDGEVTIELSLSYMTDAEQEAFVDERVQALQAELFSKQMNDEQRELAAHNWVVTHVEYDEDGVIGELRYTAYGAVSEGLAVCQGYALIFYRLCRAAGLEARIVPGLGSGEDHAWNLVRVCGSWYHVDVTWDDPVSDPPTPDRVQYGYFNRSDAQLREDHTWEPEGFPQGVTDYVSGVCAGETSLLSWTSDRDEAVSTAISQDKQVVAVVGHPDGPGTTDMLHTVFQWYWPKVRPLLDADFVVWLCDVDASDQWQPLAVGMGVFDLPLICVVDPRSPDAALARLTGSQSPNDFLDWLRPWAPSAGTAVMGTSWGRVKQQVGDAR